MNYDYKALEELGYTGTVNDRIYKYLGDLGYDGSLNDRLYKHFSKGLGYDGGLNDMQRKAAVAAGYSSVHNYANEVGIVGGAQANARNIGTPVDIFIYDTKEDSDGGAWAKEVQTNTRPELITNGTFDSDISGWTNNVGTGSIAWNSSGYIDLEVFSVATQAVTTVVGQEYTFSAEIITASTRNILQVGTTATGSEIYSSPAYITSTGVKSVTFTATSTTTYIRIKNDTGSSGTSTWDNISVTEVGLYKSWYWEELNTATRGSTRAFPEVAVIVAETNKVTIYDGTKASLPMWHIEDYTGLTLSSVAAINGQVAIGASTGLVVSDYISDDLGTTTLDYTTSTSPAIVNNVVNDVAMTSISGSETQPNSSVLVPTIAVATNGGVSVILDDGTVVDSSETVGMAFVQWGDNDRLFYNDDSSDQVYYADTYAADGFSDGHYDADAAPYLLPGNVTGTALNALGQADGLSLLYEDQSTQANGSVANITSDYNTGWMQGDIELSLCDGTTDRSVSATLVTDNGSAVVAAVNTNAEQNQITATGGTLTATVTTGGAIYGWEKVSGSWVFRANTGWVGVSESAGTLTVADGTVFSMLRYTNGAGPSAGQFTQIEADELPLFQEGAKCTLYGSSDAVTALAYDSGTSLLHVGTSGGRSVFSGLKRISSSATAVTTAIDADDGMVVEY